MTPRTIRLNYDPTQPHTATKYKSRKVTRTGPDGTLLTFDSMAEADRYDDLRLLEQEGRIKNLRVHHRWRLEVNGVLVGHYTDDASYIDCETGEPVVEDTKASGGVTRTEAYRMRRRLMRACWNIDIVEVEA